jgi:TPR repeat protein
MKSNKSPEDQFTAKISNALTLIERDAPAAIAQLKELTKNGSDLSAWNLGYIYHSGEYISKDLTLAKFWYEKCNLSDPALNFSRGLIKDEVGELKEAFALYEKANEKVYPPAQFKIGYALFYGRGIYKDKQLGLKLVSESAKLSYLPARRWLALMQIKGIFGISRVPTGIYDFCRVVLDTIKTVARGQSIHHFDGASF